MKFVFEKFWTSVFIILLIYVLCILLFGCTHTGTVVFKGYSPAEYSIGYKPAHNGKGIVKRYVYHNAYYYAIIKTENGEYEKIKVNYSIEEGDIITKHTMYYEEISKQHIRMIGNLNK